MARTRHDGRQETAAIDWAYLGIGVIGEEIGTLVAMSLGWLDIDVKEATELDAIVFASYLEGLRDAGWQDDAQLVRFGYAATAALYVGIGWASFAIPGWFDSEDRNKFAEKQFGHPIEDILKQYAVLQSYLLDLGDEALKLMGVMA